MKRKIAILLASVMTLSLLPMNVFAASSARLTGLVATVKNEAIFFESGVKENGANDVTTGALGITAGTQSTGADYNVDGNDLVITLTDPVTVGQQFNVTLENAKWYFRDINGKMGSNGTTPGSVTTYQSLYAANALYGGKTNPTTGDVITSSSSALMSVFTPGVDGQLASDASLIPTQQYTTYSGQDKDDDFRTSVLPITYADKRGVYFTQNYPVPSDSTKIDSQTGYYYRFANLPGSNLNNNIDYHNNMPVGWTAQIPYQMSIMSQNPKQATVTILNDDATNPTSSKQYGAGYEIRIPLVTRTKGTPDIKVRVDSGINGIASSTLLYGMTGGGATKTTAISTISGRDEFELDSVAITETKIGSIVPNLAPYTDSTGAHNWSDWVAISAPSGYTFANNFSSIQLSVKSGLAWKSASGAPNYTGTVLAKDMYNTPRYAVTGNNTSDNSVMWVYLGGIVPSTGLAGTVYVSGLKLVADDDAPVGDVTLKIDDVNNSISDIVSDNDSFVAANRTDWNVVLAPVDTTPVPTLVNGRYVGSTNTLNDYSMFNAKDEIHKTISVKLYENATNSWWAGRQTLLTLSDNAKFRKVKVHDDSDIEVFPSGASDGSTTQGIFVNDGIKRGNSFVKDNVFTMNNLKVKAGKKGGEQFDIWVSLESGKEGDVTLTASGTSITGQDNPKVVIAKSVNPITVTTKVTDVKIGYQYQPTQDIQITEQGAGYLLKNKTVFVSISDLTSSDITLSPDTKVAVSNGDLSINNISLINNGSAINGTLNGTSANTDTKGTFSFQIDKASTKASTITLSNVAVKVDRSVPVTNYQNYKVYVWGTAIAENFGNLNGNVGSGVVVSTNGNAYNGTFTPIKAASGTLMPNRDMFQTPGIAQDYIKVVSAANDNPSVLTQEVRVTQDETYYSVNGATSDMDAAAYVSTASNSMMVPVRFVANAFGLRDDQVVWDDPNKTVTIISPTKVIQFSKGSDNMIVNGAKMAMVSPDGKTVTPEIKGDAGHERMYIPFRALGNAFGVTVTWDADTKTAIYNQDANSNKDAASTTAQ